jgi:chloramphenicol 3-O phosphotransferase
MAPAHILEERERVRGNRIVGEARAQVGVIHHGVAYDLTVDTSRQSPEECAGEILAALVRPGPASSRSRGSRRTGRQSE